MRTGKKFVLLLSAAIFIVFGVFSCKNPLVSVIDEEVVVAVTPPEVLSVFPEDLDDDVPVTLSTIIVNLTKNVDSSSVNATSFSVTDASGSVISGSREVEDATITFKPNAELAVGTQYTVVIDGIMDVDGNTISERYSWSFITGIEGDTVKPTISSVVLNDGAEWTNSTSVSVRVIADDNFGIAQMNISTTGNFTESGWSTWAETFTIDVPDGDGEKHIYVKVKDGTGLESVDIGDGTINLDTVAPVKGLFNVDGGNSGTRESTVNINIAGYDETAGSGIYEYRFHAGEDAWGDWSALVDGSALLEDHPLTVSSGESESFYMQLRDLAGNESETYTESIERDFSPPTVDFDLSYPVPESSNNSVESYVKLVFSEQMDTSTINNLTVYLTKGTEIITTPDSMKPIMDKKTVEFISFESGGGPYVLEQNTSYNVFISVEVTDVAGNPFSSDYTYSFSNGRFVDSEAPTGLIVLDLENETNNATQINNFDLMIKAEDDYNGVREVKIWGDSDGSLPRGESDASWITYTEDSATVTESIPYMSFNSAEGFNWQLGTSDGEYNIYYKFRDYAYNESEVPGRLSVSYDRASPTVNEVITDDGTGFSRNTNHTANLMLDVDDAVSGVESMWIEIRPSDQPAATQADADVDGDGDGVGDWWEPFSSLKAAYPVTLFDSDSDDVEEDFGEGEYTIYCQVKDYAGLTSPVYSTNFILDYTAPDIFFGDSNIIFANEIKQQHGDLSDFHSDYDPNDPTALDGTYKISSGTASWEWELSDGPETLSEFSLKFYDDEVKTTETNTVEAPFVEVDSDDGTEDGVYQLKVTVTDNAGNSNYGFVDFTWDTIAPSEMGVVTISDSESSIITTSAAGAIAYTNEARPAGSWDAVDGADFYVAIPSASNTLEPNVEAPDQWGGVDWYPHWDDDEVDWTDSSTYEDKNYMKLDTTSLLAPAPDGPGATDGAVYLYVAAFDKAGNHSNISVDEVAQFHIDTLKPVIELNQNLPPSRVAHHIDFRSTDDLGYGFVYDQLTTEDPDNGGDTDSGSGIASYSWREVTEEPEVIDFDDSSIIDPTINAAADGSEDAQYQLELTVIDNAGNSEVAYVDFLWDTTKPAPTVISALDHTPSSSPTWTWTSGGNGGNGTYRYRLEQIGRYEIEDPVQTGGDYYGSTSDVVAAYSDESTDLSLDPLDTDYPGPFTTAYEYTLYVQERDDAGNWSDESSQPIWIDASYTAPPAVSRDGAYLRNGYTGERTVTWSWTTGIGDMSSYQFRYMLRDSSDNDVISWTDLSVNEFSVTLDLSGYADDVYTLWVQEYNLSDPLNPVLVSGDKYGTSTVETDATAPSAPSMVSFPGSTWVNADNTSYYLTHDTTPYLSWTYGSDDGVRQYRWSFDEASWTETGSNYITPTLSEDDYILYVQERDEAGNWSASMTHRFEIDVTSPTLSSILLENRHANAYNTTSYTLDTDVKIGITASGSNNMTFTGNDIRYMRFWNSGGTKSGWYTYSSSLAAWYLSTGVSSVTDGYKYVYCELQDYAGNTSYSRYDYINLDRSAPSISSFTINSNAASSSSYQVTLNSVFDSDTYVMRMSNDNGANWSSWTTDSSSKTWNLDTTRGYSGYGTKKVMVQITDYAGYYCRDASDGDIPESHYSSDDDFIFYGSPSIKYATKGLNNTGQIDVYFNDYDDTFSNANNYYLYYSTSPGGKTPISGSTTELEKEASLSEGYVYYFTVRVYNSSVGSYSDYSTSNTADLPNICGFSSDITIIYDDDDSTDTTLASGLSSFVKYGYISSSSFSAGSYYRYIYDPITRKFTSVLTYYSDPSPAWTVTRLPEDLISTGFTSPNTLIYGDPIIITPGVDFSYLNQMRNVAASGKGILGMYYPGARLISYASSYWTSWGLNSIPSENDTSNPQPTEIDSVSYRGGPTLYTDTHTDADARQMWYKYFYYDYGGTAYNSTYYSTARDNVALFLGSSTASYGEAYRYSIYYSGTDIPTANYAYFYSKDPDSSVYYTVARQGRYAYWGYNKYPYFNRGKPLFHNLVRYLNAAY